MNLRSFAVVLLVPFALGGCDQDPLGPRGSELVGNWESDMEPLLYTAPNGSTDVRQVQTWSFSPTGSFVHTTFVLDFATGRHWVMREETGRWKAADESLREEVRALFSTDPSTAVDAPDLSPVVPFVESRRYRLENGTLYVYNAERCPPGVYCAGPTPFHRFPMVF